VSDPIPYTITIPHTPPSGNTWNRMHYHDQDDLVKAWAPVVSAAVGVAGKAWFDRARVEAVMYFKSNRRRDVPNYLLTLDKLIIDHFKGRIIPDDNSDVLPEYRLRFENDRKNPRTEVTLVSLHEKSPAEAGP
jgi:hypothetical protein